MKRVVITGATGAIGRALIGICIKAGYEVLLIVHRESQRASDIENNKHCKILRLDLCEYDLAIDEMRKQGIEGDGYELFFHLAWQATFGKDRDDSDLQLENVKAALAAVRFAKALGCKTFIGTGSQAEYGRVEGKISPNTPTFPETGYGIAKLCAGQLTRISCEQLGMRHIWCRVLSVYGPYDRDQTLISYAVIQMMKREAVELSPCNQMWDYIYSDDAARAIFIAGEKGKNNSVYVIGSGEVLSLKEYILKIAEITGYDQEIGFGKRTYNEKQVMYLQADISGLTELGFRTQVPFEDGIKKLIKNKSGLW